MVIYTVYVVVLFMKVSFKVTGNVRWIYFIWVGEFSVLFIEHCVIYLSKQSDNI